MRLYAAVIALAAAVVAPVGSQAPEPRAAEVDTRAGRVVGADGAPLRGVRVQLLEAGPEAAGPGYSDEEGRYVLTVRPRRATTARFSKAGFVTTTREFGDPAVRLAHSTCVRRAPRGTAPFTIHSLSPGDYRVVALDDLPLSSVYR